MNRYEIITYSRDNGEDEKMDYRTIAEARKASRQYVCDDYYDSVIIYDLIGRGIITLKGNHFDWLKTA